MPLHGRRGETNGADLIRLHPEQLQVERRCTITHEVVHVERGHRSGCAPAVERSVRAETARRLISLPALLDALAWTQDWHEAADHLWVTVEVLRDRIDALTPGERAALVERYERVEPGA
ncbi:ImmA/IrrE family metallo-endopeptidase [Miniimonas sp. S16]|uniref:ImmA/IrrE family metallo-endopeptidase n=1 Tax=Miniimonas sp. S16 TaxID=2171623 RepID=UPI001F1FC24C|nr:ImmA/IrrE family metallo-endopeptidase [Miniimonas sp. S16]